MSGFKFSYYENGVYITKDIESILQMKSWFTTSGSSYTNNTGYKVGTQAQDIKDRYAKIDISPNNLIAATTSYKVGGSDLNTIFCKKNEVFPDRFVRVQIFGGRGTWDTNNYSPGEATSNLSHYRDHGRIHWPKGNFNYDFTLGQGEYGYMTDYYNRNWNGISNRADSQYDMATQFHFLGCGAYQISYHVLDFSSEQNYYIKKCYGGSGGTASASGRNAGYGGRTLALSKSTNPSASDIIAVAGAGGGAGSGNGIFGSPAWFQELDYDENGVANDYRLEYTKYYSNGNDQVERGRPREDMSYPNTNYFDPVTVSRADQGFYNNIGQYADWAYGINAKHWHTWGGGGGWQNVGYSGGGGGGLLTGGNGQTANGWRRSAGGGGGGAGMYGGGGALATNTGDGDDGSPGGGSGSSFAERNSLIDNGLNSSYSTVWLPSIEFDPFVRINYYAMENRNTVIGTAEYRFSQIGDSTEIPRI
tara:strand:- start:784 stop:2208 length:1425 start_codon:yes stop_codon:yes gene_type:complete